MEKERFSLGITDILKRLMEGLSCTGAASVIALVWLMKRHTVNFFQKSIRFPMCFNA